MRVDNIDYVVIEGTDERYYISRCGKVWDSLNDIEVSQVLTGIPQYKYVNLQLPEGRKLKRVHRLVAETFISNLDNLKYVDHIDRDKLNNNVDNLRWATRSENQRNRSNNVILKDGTFLKDWCLRYEDKDTAYSIIYNYKRKYGITLEEAIFIYENPDERLKYNKLINMEIIHGGITYKILDFIEEFGLDLTDTRLKLHRGWSTEEIIMGCTDHQKELQIEYNGIIFKSSVELSEYLGLCTSTVSRIKALDGNFDVAYSKYIKSKETRLDKVFTYKGKEMSLGDIIEISGTDILTRVIIDRVLNNGWDLERALTEKPRIRYYFVDGKKMQLKELYLSLGLTRGFVNSVGRDGIHVALEKQVSLGKISKEVIPESIIPIM